MTPSPSALPASLTVATWNGDHLMVLDTKGNFHRRNSKLRILNQIFKHHPQVIFIQEPGKFLFALQDWARRSDFLCYISQTPDRTGGVVTLVQRSFAERFSLTFDVVVPGHVTAVRSSQQLSFCLSIRTSPP
jgi:hypothetical protein